jgi:Concanavalin A-like lectin/glucanases superfamily/Tyrosine-protein kinase ephrin type A/B receptor-like
MRLNETGAPTRLTMNTKFATVSYDDKLLLNRLGRPYVALDGVKGRAVYMNGNIPFVTDADKNFLTQEVPFDENSTLHKDFQFIHGSNRSISMWVRPSSLSSGPERNGEEESILIERFTSGKNYGWTINVFYDRFNCTHLPSNNVCTSVRLYCGHEQRAQWDNVLDERLNQWAHLVFVMQERGTFSNGSTTVASLELYRDGMRLPKSNYPDIKYTPWSTTYLAKWSTTLQIGNRGVHTADDAKKLYRFDGMFDEVQYWRIALSEVEIKALYNDGCACDLGSGSNQNITSTPKLLQFEYGGSCGTRTSTIYGQYRFDEPVTSNSIVDSSGYHRNMQCLAAHADVTRVAQGFRKPGALAFDGGSTSYLTLGRSPALISTLPQSTNWSFSITAKHTGGPGTVGMKIPVEAKKQVYVSIMFHDLAANQDNCSQQLLHGWEFSYTPAQNEFKLSFYRGLDNGQKPIETIWKPAPEQRPLYGQWIHLLVSHNAYAYPAPTIATLFFNGIPIDAGVVKFSQSIPCSEGITYLGATIGSANRFVGEISEFTVWSGSKTPIDAAREYELQSICPNSMQSDPGGFACPSGRFINSEWKCSDCSAGTYHDITAHGDTSTTLCSMCSAGRFALPGSTFCEACPQGTYFSGTGATSASDCIRCDSNVGFVGIPNLSTGISISTACRKCRIGEYWEGDPNGATGFRCTACPAGRYGIKEGAPGIEEACSVCSAGRYQEHTNATICAACRAGTSSAAIAASNSTTCENCTAGRFSANIASHECSLTDIGWYQENAGKSFQVACPPGSHTSIKGSVQCTECPPGQFLSQRTLDCEPCSFGNYTRVKGKTSCDACGRGNFSSLQGSVGCVQCPAGRYSNTESSTKCEACPCAPFCRRTRFHCMPEM